MVEFGVDLFGFLKGKGVDMFRCVGMLMKERKEEVDLV